MRRVKEVKKICYYCRLKINKGEGGEARLPFILTLNRHPERVDIHNKCLNPLIRQIEKENKKILEEELENAK